MHTGTARLPISAVAALRVGMCSWPTASIISHENTWSKDPAPHLVDGRIDQLRSQAKAEHEKAVAAGKAAAKVKALSQQRKEEAWTLVTSKRPCKR